MLNACVVGYGAVGPVHANALSRLTNAEVYAVSDINFNRSKSCADKYGCRIYSDFDEMLTDENIDVVHICTPHYLHKEMTLKALKARKHVVLEKPVSININDVDEIMKYVNSVECKNKVCVMLQNRRNKCVEKLKLIISEPNTIGKLKGIIGNLSWNRDETYYNQDSWRGKWKTEGGGLLINQAVHLIDLMLYFGGEIKDVKASAMHWEISNIEVEDNAKALFYFKNGAKGIFNATNCYITDEPYNLELLYENAHFRYADGMLCRIFEDTIKVLEKDDKVKVGKGYWGTGHIIMIDEFYRNLSNESGIYTDINEAYNTMKCLFDMYKQSGMQHD